MEVLILPPEYTQTWLPKSHIEAFTQIACENTLSVKLPELESNTGILNKPGMIAQPKCLDFQQEAHVALN